jgi:hypothetical protein
VYLVQLLLPLRDPDGEPFPREAFEGVARELTSVFGGVTAYLRSPADGAWVDAGRVDRDRLVMVEVMTEALDRGWWAEYRSRLEASFRQDEILVRATRVERL